MRKINQCGLAVAAALSLAPAVAQAQAVNGVASPFIPEIRWKAARS